MSSSQPRNSLSTTGCYGRWTSTTICAAGAGRALQLHAERLVSAVEEDLVPHVDPSAVSSDVLTVLGRVPDGATEEEVVAHLAEAARLVRRRDIQMVRAAGLGHVGGEFSVIDILVTLYLRSMNLTPDRLGDPDRDRFI